MDPLKGSRGARAQLEPRGCIISSTPCNMSEIPSYARSDRPRVFLCHSSGDKGIVRPLCNRLRDDGMNPWLDEERLLPGQEWKEEIPKAVRNSDVVLVCISSHSVGKTGYLQREIRLALDAADEQPEGKIFIIPLRLEPCEVPERLSRWQWANLYQPDGYSRLLLAILGQPGPAAPADSAPRPSFAIPDPPLQPKPWFLRPSTYAAVLLIALVAGGLVWYSKSQANATRDPGTTTDLSNAPPPPKMQFVKGGTFPMGRDDAADAEEGPAHSVAVDSFYLDRVPTTNGDYSHYLDTTHRKAPSDWINGSYAPGQAEWPVVNVSWQEAQDYCRVGGKRLPTEKEWEYAARGSDGRLYPWGNFFDGALTNSLARGVGHAIAVGSNPSNASPFGVLDMSGNVFQWCEDDYRAYPGRKPGFKIEDDARVIRGGSFMADRNHVTATTRNLERAISQKSTIGFRCAMSVAAQ